MRVDEDQVECALCGEVLPISPDAVTRVFVSVSGGEPPERVLLVDGTVIHRCPDIGVAVTPSVTVR
jgi:hypothetical protein